MSAFRKVLESTGLVGRGVGKQHRSNATMHRQTGRRLENLENFGGLLMGATLLRNIELTTTPQNFDHNLTESRRSKLEREGQVDPRSRVSIEGRVGKEFTGAFIVERQDAGFYLIAGAPSGTTAKKSIALSVSSGTQIVSVVVF